jgi:hypothetical protein
MVWYYANWLSGSWGFFIGSILQWYESVDKNPVYEAEEGDDHH